MRVVILTHYFPPEIGAPQARLFELASRLSAGGVQVSVVTGFPNYPTGVIPPAYRGHFAMQELMDGVKVVRTWIFATPNRGFFRRLMNHVSFAVSSLWAVRRVGKADVIFVESPPLAIGLAALAYATIKRAPFIFNVSDIWPQSAIEMGALRNRLAIWAAERFELKLYRSASRVSVVTPGILEKLEARGVPHERLFLLTNGVDTSLFRKEPPNSELKNRLGLEGRKVFLYAGTHGLAQGLDVVLSAAKKTRDPSILYVLAGEGADKDRLVARAEAEGIDNVLFLPNQPRETMPGILNLAYAAVIPLRKLDIFSAALPSKMFEAMAVQVPIVLAVHGEAAELVTTARCGVVVEPENPAQLAEAVERLAADESLALELGSNGRRYAIDHFDREMVASRFRDLLQQVAASEPARGGG